MDEDLYKILSVEPKACQAEVQKAAERLYKFWSKRPVAVSQEKQSAMLSRIQNAREILTNPLKRLEYDMDRGYRRSFEVQTKRVRRTSIPLKYSESIEKLETVKIPGEFDYDKLERQLASFNGFPGISLTGWDGNAKEMKPKSLSYGDADAKLYQKEIKSIKKNGFSDDPFSAKFGVNRRTSSSRPPHTSNGNESTELHESHNEDHAENRVAPVLDVSQNNKPKDTVETMNPKKAKSTEMTMEFTSEEKATNEISKHHSEEKYLADTQDIKHSLGQGTSKNSTEKIDSNEILIPMKKLEDFYDLNHSLPRNHGTKKMDDTEELTSAKYKQSHERPDPSSSFSGKDSTSDRNSNKIGDEDLTDVEKKDTTGPKEYCTYSSLNNTSGQQNDGYGNHKTDKRLKQPMTSPEASMLTDVGEGGIGGSEKEEIREVGIEGISKEPIYLIDKEEMKALSSRDENATRNESSSKVSKIASALEMNTIETGEKYPLEEKNSDNENEIEKTIEKLSSSRTVMLNSLRDLMQLEDELIDSCEIKKSSSTKKLTDKEERTQQLMKSLQSKERQKRLEKDFQEDPNRKYSGNQAYDIKRVNSLKIIKDFNHRRKTEPDTFDYQPAKLRPPTLSLQNGRQKCYSPKLQNTIKLIEDVGKDSSGKVIPFKRVSEDINYNPAQSFKGKSKVAYLEMKQVNEPVSSHEESDIEALTVISSLIDYLKQSISMDNSKAFVEGALREEKFDPVPDISLGSDVVNLAKSESRCQEILARKPQESKENQIKLETDGQIIPTEKDPVIKKQHLDSKQVTRVQMRQKTEPNLFQKLGEIPRSPSLPLQQEQTAYSLKFQNALKLLKDVKIDQNVTPERISVGITDQNYTDESGVKLEDMKQINMALDNKIPSQRDARLSEEFISKLLEEMKSVVDYVKQKISVTDTERQMEPQHGKNLGLMDKSRDHNIQDSSHKRILDEVYQNDFYPESVAENSEIERSRGETKNLKRTLEESEDYQEIEMESRVSFKGDIPEHHTKTNSFTRGSGNNSELSLLQQRDEKPQSENLLFDQEERGSHSQKLLNAFKLLEENKKLYIGTDTIAGHFSTGIKEDTVAPDCQDTGYSETKQIRIPVDKKSSEQSTEYSEECAGVCLTDPKRSNVEHNEKESELKGKSQENILNAYLNNKGKTNLAPEISVESQPVKEDYKTYSSEVALEDSTDSEKSLVVLEKAVLKPCIDYKRKGESQYQRDDSAFVMDTLEDTEDGLDADIFSPEKKPEEERILRKWRPPPMSTEEESDEEPELQNVSATTRIAGANIRTVYHFGPNKEFIEVFINDDLKARILKDQEQDIFCNAMKHDDLPLGIDICASTVIAANGCIITTEVSRRDKRETIAVYKNDEILFRSGNTVLC